MRGEFILFLVFIFIFCTSDFRTKFRKKFRQKLNFNFFCNKTFCNFLGWCRKRACLARCFACCSRHCKEIATWARSSSHARSVAGFRESAVFLGVLKLFTFLLLVLGRLNYHGFYMAPIERSRRVEDGR